MSYVQVFQLNFSLSINQKLVNFDHHDNCEVRRFLHQKKKVKDFFKQEITKSASLIGLARTLVRYLFIAAAAFFVVVGLTTTTGIRLNVTG